MEERTRGPVCIITHMVLEPSERKVRIYGADRRRWHVKEGVFFGKFVSKFGGVNNVLGLREGSEDKGVHWTFDLGEFARRSFSEDNLQLVNDVLGQGLASQVIDFHASSSSRLTVPKRR